MKDVRDGNDAKKRKPIVEDLRPFAQTDVSYKVRMRVIGEILEVNLRINGIRLDEQAGFTEGREVLDNLYVCRRVSGRGTEEEGNWWCWQWILIRASTQ